MAKSKMKTPTARKLPSGSWCARVRINGKDICITKPTEKEAVAAALAVKAGLIDAPANGPKTLKRAIDDYIDARRDVLSPATIRGYVTIRDNRFQRAMGMRLTSISPERWQQLVNLEAKTCAAKTLKNAWGLISSVITEETGKTITVRLPQVVANERGYLDADEIKVFLEAIQGDKAEIAALLALSSLRRSELIALDWSDVDLERGKLRVVAATVPDEDNNFVRKPETKNRTSRRTVPIMKPLANALANVPQERRIGAVVTMHPGTALTRVNQICADNGLPQVGLHGLRHSFASLAYHLQLPEAITMQIGGWSDIYTMRRIYTHISQRDLDKSAGKLLDFYDTGKITKNESRNDSDNENERVVAAQ